jgi:hypothetical protein
LYQPQYGQAKENLEELCKQENGILGNACGSPSYQANCQRDSWFVGRSSFEKGEMS